MVHPGKSFESMLSSYGRKSGQSAKEPKRKAEGPSKSSRASDAGPRRGANIAMQRAIEYGANHARREVIDRQASQTLRRGLAVCIMCVDGVPYEAVWKRWASQLESEEGVEVKFFIHVHHSHLCRSKWVKTHAIKEEFDTKWGSIELVCAATALLRAALKDTTFGAQYFAFASETCLPIAAATEVASELFSTGEARSWLMASNAPNDGYSKMYQFDSVSRDFPHHCVWKADQWLLLSRLHVRLVLRADEEVQSYMRIKKAIRNEPLWCLFQRCKAADEIYFPSILALCGELSEAQRIAESRIVRRQLTWCNWTEASGPSPLKHSTLTEDIVRTARAQGCLFARKFTPQAVPDVDSWEAIIQRAHPKRPISLLSPSEKSPPHKRRDCDISSAVEPGSATCEVRMTSDSAKPSNTLSDATQT